MLKKARSLVGTFKHSSTLTHILKEVMEKINSANFEAFLLSKDDLDESDHISMSAPDKLTSLKQDVVTRWNSTFFMLQSVCDNHEAIQCVFKRPEYQKYLDSLLDPNELCKSEIN
jgi:hypothetical protein